MRGDAKSWGLAGWTGKCGAEDGLDLFRVHRHLAFKQTLLVHVGRRKIRFISPPLNLSDCAGHWNPLPKVAASSAGTPLDEG